MSGVDQNACGKRVYRFFVRSCCYATVVLRRPIDPNHSLTLSMAAKPLGTGLSCSLACADFFERDAVPVEEAP